MRKAKVKKKKKRSPNSRCGEYERKPQSGVDLCIGSSTQTKVLAVSIKGENMYLIGTNNFGSWHTPLDHPYIQEARNPYTDVHWSIPVTANLETTDMSIIKGKDRRNCGLFLRWNASI